MDELSKIDRIKLLKENHANLALPGGQFMERAEKGYIGGWPAWTGTLFFKDAHTPAVRDAICACFKEYEDIAKEHLTWLWREEPPDGKDCLPYRDAKPMPDLMKQLGEDSLVAFGYKRKTESRRGRMGIPSFWHPWLEVENGHVVGSFGHALQHAAAVR